VNLPKANMELCIANSTATLLLLLLLVLLLLKPLRLLVIFVVVIIVVVTVIEEEWRKLDYYELYNLRFVGFEVNMMVI
jgi:hypothetical protein